MELIALQIVADGGRGVVVADAVHVALVGDQLLGLHIDLGALVSVKGLGALLEQLIQLRVVDTAVVGGGHVGAQSRGLQHLGVAAGIGVGVEAHLGAAITQGGDPGGGLQGLDLHVDADIGQVSLDDFGHADQHVLGVHGHSDGQLAGLIAGLGQLLLGQIRVVVISIQIIGVAGNLRSQEGGGGGGIIAEHVLHQGVAVDGVGDGLAQGLVLQDLAVLLVEVDEADGGGGLAVNGDIGVIQQDLDAGGSNLINEVGLAGLQHNAAGVGVGDELPNQVGDLSLLAPVVVKADLSDLNGGSPLAPLVRAGAGAGGVLAEVVAQLGDSLLADDGHAHGAQGGVNAGVGLQGLEVEGVLIHDLKSVGIKDVCSGNRLGVGNGAGHGEDAVGGLHLLAVMELDALLQLDLIGQVVQLLDGLSQQRRGVVVLIEIQHSFIHLEHELSRSALGLVRRIGADDLLVKDDGHRVLGGRGTVVAGVGVATVAGAIGGIATIVVTAASGHDAQAQHSGHDQAQHPFVE